MRQPVDRVAEHLDVRDRRGTVARIRSTSARSRRAASARSASDGAQAAAAATTAGTSGTPGTRPPRARPPGRASASECRCGPPARRRVGPPHVRASPASTDQPSGLGAWPSVWRRHRRPAARRRAVGDRGDRLRRADLVVGGLQAAAATPSARARPRRTRPGRPGPVRRRRPTRPPPCATCCGGVQHRGVLDRAVHERAPARRLPASVPSTAACSAWCRSPVKLTSSGRAPSASATRFAGRVEQQPRRAGQRRTAGPGRPSRRRARRAAPRARPGAAARRTRRPDSRRPTVAPTLVVAGPPTPSRLQAQPGPVGSETIAGRVARGGSQVRRRRWVRGGPSRAVLAGALCAAAHRLLGPRTSRSDLRFGWPTGVTKQAERCACCGPGPASPRWRRRASSGA